MSRSARLTLLAGSLAAALAVGSSAPAGSTHVYPVSLKISVDRAADRIGGKVITDAPSEFCEGSKIRLRRVMRGKDRVVAKVSPEYGEWRMRSTRAMRGRRVYAEVLRYHLPSRPVECLGARSRAVRAP